MGKDRYGNYMADIDAPEDSEGDSVSNSHTALTKEVFDAPVLPFSYTATVRSIVEIYWTGAGTSNHARLKAARTGVPDVDLFSIGSEDGGEQTGRGCTALRLGPGDTLDLTDDQDGPAQSLAIFSIIVWKE